MLARAGPARLCHCPKSTPAPSLLLPTPDGGGQQASTPQAARVLSPLPRFRLVEGSTSRPPFMRGALLLMAEHFNDWDLQAVVRSCASVAHPDHAAVDPRPERELETEAAPAEPTTPAAARGEAPLRAAVPPAAATAQGQERAVAKGGAALLYDLEYLDLDHKPFLLPVTPPPPPRVARAAGDDVREREVMISFPAAAAAAASTSGMQPRAVTVPPGRKAGARTPRPKRSKKSQLKKVVREMPVADGGASSSDPWAWRKYGQKPIKGSPYPRGYYKCSSMKGCMARKLVERSPAKPGVLIVTYMAEHCHPVPTQLNALAGTTRHKAASSAEDNAASSSSPKSHEHGPSCAGRDGAGAADDAARCDVDSNGKSAATGLEFGAEEIAAADDDNELWPAGMNLDELLAPVDDDFDFEPVMDDEDGVLGRRLSL